MTIISPLPFNLQNGTTADATQVMADFNEIFNDVNAHAAHNGTNSDITALTALSTPLSPAQGGTGFNTSAWAQGFLFGLTLSNDSGGTTAIAVAAGTAADSTATTFMTLASALTGKVLGTLWSVGNNGGLLDTGSIGNNTYHIFLIKRTDTGVVDALASLSATAPTLPTNYSLFRRIGSIVRASGAIKKFTQIGDYFWWLQPQLDYNAGFTNNVQFNIALACPTGILIEAIFIGGIGYVSGAQSNLYLYPTFESGLPGIASLSTASTVGITAQFRLPTDTSATISAIANTGGGSPNVTAGAQGWIDNRGRLF